MSKLQGIEGASLFFARIPSESLLMFPFPFSLVAQVLRENHFSGWIRTVTWTIGHPCCAGGCSWRQVRDHAFMFLAGLLSVALPIQSYQLNPSPPLEAVG